MLQKSKNFSSISIFLLVFILCISGTGEKSQKFQNWPRITEIIFIFSGGNVEGCYHLWKCGQKMSKFWLNLGVGKCSIQFRLASDENLELKFATLMALVMFYRMPKNCHKKSKLGQNMSSQNSKFTQIEALRIQTWWLEKLLMLCKYALLVS